MLKDNVIAEIYRTRGNESYKKRFMYAALTFYNKSLCHAEKDTSALGLVYANRSAIYLEMKLYERSIRNIQLALKHNYPKEKICSLMQRQDRCVNMMRNENESQEYDPAKFFKLSHLANNRYPYISNCLELRWNEEYGRHVISNIPLNIGDIIAVDTSFYKVLWSDPSKDNYSDNVCYQFCAFCLKSNCLDLKSCAECSKTMYCSDECEKQAFQQYHCYECEISEQLQDMNDHFIVVRSFFKALTICNNSIEELKEMITSKLPKKSQLTMFDFDFSSMDSNESQKNLILVMCSGVSDKDTRLHPLIEVLLKRHSVVGKIMDTHRDFIMDFMLKRLR